MNIDLTKQYVTREKGHLVKKLRQIPKPGGVYTLVGDIYDGDPGDPPSEDETWTEDGRYIANRTECELDLVPAPVPGTPNPESGLLIPDALRGEYGAFVEAVKANFAAGTFATASQEQFDAWLEILTPSLKA